MTYRSRTRKGPLAEINVVPYIDVMLVLLVIFMITAPLLTQGVQVQLPKGHAKTIKNGQQIPIVITVDKYGRYYLNTASHPKQTVNGQQLLTQVIAQLAVAKQRHQQRPVYVKGDVAAHYGEVVQAMLLLQAAGIQQVGLITQTAQYKSR